jgi:oligopeptide transport system permease protein
MSEKFTYEDSKHTSRTIDISPEDFTFVQKDTKLSDAKFQSKPTTFFKDAMKRFAKNKSSVVGAIILGVLLLLAFILPSAMPSDIKGAHPYEIMLQPKLNEAGFGWWDGCKAYSDIVYNPTTESPAGYEKRAVLNLNKTNSKTDEISQYARGGYLRYFMTQNTVGTSTVGEMDLATYNFDLTHNYTINYTIKGIPEGGLYGSDGKNYFGDKGQYAITFTYIPAGESAKTIILKDYTTDSGDFTIDLTKTLTDNGITVGTVFTSANYPLVSVSLKDSNDYATNVLIQKFVVSSDSADATEKENLSKISVNDAEVSLNDSLYKPSILGGQLTAYNADIWYCSFRYDTYEAAFGIVPMGLERIDYNRYVEKGWMTMDLDTYLASGKTAADLSALQDSFKILDDTHCPIRAINSVDASSVNPVLNCQVSMYRYRGYTSMPKYLFGTGDDGKDLLKVTFTGLRTSLLLGILTSAVCFCFGLVWGAIAGYFGGWTDIIMERFVDILGGLPWIVIMTICIIKMGSNFTTFALALCLTGWMGTSSITRTQFYRYKSREYILAARTLGASDMRLIFRHILPNAVGTIITSSVLMIPSVIFSEATISYLGLGLQGLTSLGVTLSNNQKFVSTDAYLIMFPSAIMALIMISFNLFGNGLRDAFNPSLKGEE